MVELPTGTVTYLITDLEGSTRLWEEHPETMSDGLARHDAILRGAVEGHDGVVFSTMGDGIAAAFASVSDALAAALDAQRRLATEEWGEAGPLRARMGLHTDEGRLRAPGEYVNRPLNRCARLMSVAHGGQVLVSDATAIVARGGLPLGAGLLDLGEHRLRDLAEPVRVFQVIHPDLPREFAPLRSLDALPGNLPLQPTELVGRETELTDLTATLRLSRLVTLTGVGGVGKTRLALQVAADTLPRYRDGAWLCELGPLTNADAVPEAVAGALSVQARAGQTITDTLVDFLRAKNLLLVLDNCEHLLDTAARLVDRIERECPGVTVLATSREGLALRGEHIVAVPSLPTDDAARLFADRAAEVRAGFSLSGENEPAVRQLCERLDGIPLAIELAAARLRSMTASELIERLDHRFRLLTGGSRTALERHQTLRATVDWSYELLGPAERTLLSRLAVFAGGFTLGAAEAVAADEAIDRVDVFDLLAQLVDKSLVIAEEHAGTTRYRFLETIRQYAQEQLEKTGDADVVRRRHAEHYVALAETAAPHLRGRDQLAWVERLATELDNLRAVMTWAAGAAEADLALRLAIATSVNGVQMSHTALGWAEAAAAIPAAAEHPSLPDALGWAAWGAVYRADLERARELVSEMYEAEQRLGVAPAPARCQGPATLALFAGQFDDATEHGQRWVELARAAGDDYQLVQGLTMLASSYQTTGIDVRVPMLEEAVELGRRVGAPGILSWALSGLGSFLSELDAERALAVLAESAAVGTLVGNEQGVSQTLTMTAWVRRKRGERDGALEAAAKACEYAHQIGARNSAAQALVVTALVLSDVGEHEPAVVLAGYADRVFGGNWGTWADERLSFLGAARDALGAERVAELEQRGSRLDDVEAVDLARLATERALALGT